jgi:hypothetical protein
VTAGERHVLPHENQPARGELLQREFEERSGHAGADRKADGADGERLQQDDADEPAVGDADGFERAELFQVLDGEKVEGLPRDDRADDERDGDGDAEVHRDARVGEVVADAVPAKLFGRARAQAGVRFDPARQLHVADARLGPREDERELFALAPLEVDRLGVARVNHRKAQERRRRIGDANDGDLVIVQLQRAAQLKRLLREKEHVARFVDDDSVGLAQALPRAEQHLARRAGERGVI